VTYVSDPQSITVEENMNQLSNIPKCFDENAHTSGTSFWQSTCGWPDNTSKLFLLFHVVKRKRTAPYLHENILG
jgi:hypothetical protein